MTPVPSSAAPSCEIACSSSPAFSGSGTTIGRPATTGPARATKGTCKRCSGQPLRYRAISGWMGSFNTADIGSMAKTWALPSRWRRPAPSGILRPRGTRTRRGWPDSRRWSRPGPVDTTPTRMMILARRPRPKVHRPITITALGITSENATVYSRVDSVYRLRTGLDRARHRTARPGRRHDLKAGAEYETTSARQEYGYPSGVTFYDTFGEPTLTGGLAGTVPPRHHLEVGSARAGHVDGQRPPHSQPWSAIRVESRVSAGTARVSFARTTWRRASGSRGTSARTTAPWPACTTAITTIPSSPAASRWKTGPIGARASSTSRPDLGSGWRCPEASCWTPSPSIRTSNTRT